MQYVRNPEIFEARQVTAETEPVTMGVGITGDAHRGDWIIRAADGSLGVLSDEAFRAMYSPAPQSLTGPLTARLAEAGAAADPAASSDTIQSTAGAWLEATMPDPPPAGFADGASDSSDAAADADTTPGE